MKNKTAVNKKPNMKKLALLLLLAALWLPGLTHAQTDAGFFVRESCAALTNPVNNATLCLNIGSGSLEAGRLYIYASNDWRKLPISTDLDHGGLTGLVDDDHTQYTLAFSNAGAPAAGSCTSSREIIVDTTNEELYFCSDGAGGNPRKAHAMSITYTSVQGDSGSASPPAGGAALTISGGAQLTVTCADGSPDTCTIALDNHVKSIYFPANALTVDGTQCAEPALVTINSGPRIWAITCADNDGSTIYGHVVMPDSWNAGTVTFELEYVQTAADTSALNSDIAAQCRGPGEAISNSWGTEIAIDDAAVSGSNAVDHTTSAAVTATGTCAAGDSLFFRWQLDAAGTTTAVATLYILGVKMEYTVSGSGSD